jgi:hypothetical protein
MFNSQAFVSTFILVGLFFMTCLSAQVSLLHSWWPVKMIARLVALTCLALMVAHIAYLFVGA